MVADCSTEEVIFALSKWLEETLVVTYLVLVLHMNNAGAKKESDWPKVKTKETEHRATLRERPRARLVKQYLERQKGLLKQKGKRGSSSRLPT
jgi:hypothetical protein